MGILRELESVERDLMELTLLVSESYLGIYWRCILYMHESKDSGLCRGYPAYQS